MTSWVLFGFPRGTSLVGNGRRLQPDLAFVQPKETSGFDRHRLIADTLAPGVFLPNLHGIAEVIVEGLTCSEVDAHCVLTIHEAFS